MDSAGIDARWDFNDPAASERVFRDLLADATASGNTALRTELLTQIARAQGLQGRVDEARATLEQAAPLVPYAGRRAHIRHLLESGRLLNSAGDPTAAMPLFQSAWELARTAGEDALAVDAAHMLGIVTEPSEQIEWAQRALDLAERSDESAAQRWRGPLLNNLGWSLLDRHQPDAALDVFQQALAWQKQAGSRSGVLMARHAMGRALRSLGRYDEAISTQREIIDDPDAADGPAGYAAEELGELYQLLGRPREAAPYLAQAAEILSRDPWISAHEPDRLARLRQRARLPSPHSETTSA